MKKSTLFLSLISILFIFTSALYADAKEAKTKRFKNAFDKNSDGVVSEEEYISTRSKWGKPVEESEKYFRYHDKNKDGQLTLEEFLSSK
tara:strand:+ start:819 stop:1085 length:267 start_codon:yes stop_codon:yes gene_type:complete